MKTCARCRTVKPTTDYRANRSMPDGRDHYCRECRLAYRKTAPAKATAAAKARILRDFGRSAECAELRALLYAAGELMR